MIKTSSRIVKIISNKYEASAIQHVPTKRNTVHILENQNHKIVLKIYQPGKEHRCINEVNGLSIFATTKTFRTPNIMEQGIIEGQAYLVLEFLDIIFVHSDSSAEQWFQVGCALAKLHSEKHVGYALQLGMPKTLNWEACYLPWIEPYAQQLISVENDKRKFLVEKALAHLIQFNLWSPARLTHGDIKFANIGHIGSELCALDFEFSGFRPPLWDLNRLFYILPQDSLYWFLRGYSPILATTANWQRESILLRCLDCIRALCYYNEPRRNSYWTFLVELLSFLGN